MSTISLNEWKWIILGAFFSALPSTCLKEYISTKNIIWLYISIIINTLFLYAYYILLKDYQPLHAFPLIELIAIIIVVAINMLILREIINTRIVIVGIISIVLVCFLAT